MNKTDFLTELKIALNGLPEDDVEERLAFYAEMIDDRMEEGMTESQAVEGVGSVKEIVLQIVADIPLKKLVKTKFNAKRTTSAKEIVLIAAGFPLWFSLLAAVAAVAFSLYAALWAIVVSLWAAAVSLVAGGAGGVALAGVYAVTGRIVPALAVLGAGLVLAGISIFAVYGCSALTKGVVKLTKAVFVNCKKLFIKKEIER